MIKLSYESFNSLFACFVKKKIIGEFKYAYFVLKIMNSKCITCTDLYYGNASASRQGSFSAVVLLILFLLYSLARMITNYTYIARRPTRPRLGVLHCKA